VWFSVFNHISDLQPAVPLPPPKVTTITLNLLKLSYRDRVCICNWTSLVNQSLPTAVLMSLCVIQKCSNYRGMRHVVGQGGDHQISLGKLHGKSMRFQEKIYHSMLWLGGDALGRLLMQVNANKLNNYPFRLWRWLHWPDAGNAVSHSIALPDGLATLRSLQNLIFRGTTSINEITRKTFSRWKITPIR
jgi:hypothetical protein